MDATSVDIIDVVGWTITISVALSGVIFTLVQSILKRMESRVDHNEESSDSRYNQLLEEISNTNKNLAMTNENIAQMSSSIKYLVEREVPTIQDAVKSSREETTQQINDVHRRINHEILPFRNISRAINPTLTGIMSIKVFFSYI